jgi:hypothetical protein
MYEEDHIKYAIVAGLGLVATAVGWFVFPRLV